MEKVFSARVDEAVLDDLDRAVRKLGITKRQFLEEAIRLRVQELAQQEDMDIWAETLGAWRRREAAAAIVRRARRHFQRSFERHHRGA